jgi:hypothetical protein
MLFKIEGAGSIGSDASTSLSRLNARLLDQEVDQTQQPFTSKPTALSVRGIKKQGLKFKAQSVADT